MPTEAQKERIRVEVARLVGAIRWEHEHDGSTEAELVRATGLARNTVRAAMNL